MKGGSSRPFIYFPLAKVIKGAVDTVTGYLGRNKSHRYCYNTISNHITKCRTRQKEVSRNKIARYEFPLPRTSFISLRVKTCTDS